MEVKMLEYTMDVDKLDISISIWTSKSILTNMISSR